MVSKLCASQNVGAGFKPVTRLPKRPLRRDVDRIACGTIADDFPHNVANAQRASKQRYDV